MIEKGESQVVRRGVGDDGRVSVHFHPECEKYSKRFDSDEWESGPFDISRAKIIETLKSEEKP